MVNLTQPEFLEIYNACRVIDCHMPVQDAKEFWWLLEKIQALNPQKILEIGSEQGGTLRVWQRVVAPIGLTVSVDLLVHRPESVGEAAHVQIIGDSHSPEIIAQVAEHAPFDFVFIDGDHTHEGVILDHDTYRTMVRPGGIMGFHDTGPSGPAKAAFESFPGNKSTIYHTMGIGVIQL